ncbi:MAG: nitrous oxide reductase accessory protein NosL [Muriicola sp.]|nr:nitrous oxide reductase accessory protein NosL [Muriicola sp.]
MEPKPIAYGKEGCHFCRMTIVDQQHAAQIVTKKGKVFSFDAIECMMKYTKEIDADEVQLFLCNDYIVPQELIDARKATFLISEKIPSPMGAFLTGFETREAAKEILSDNEGQLYTWKELVQHFN